MSKPRRRKQKKQVKPELKLRQFAATELSDRLAAQHSAADLPRFMVDTVAGHYSIAWINTNDVITHSKLKCRV